MIYCHWMALQGRDRILRVFMPDIHFSIFVYIDKADLENKKIILIEWQPSLPLAISVFAHPPKLHLSINFSCTWPEKTWTISKVSRSHLWISGNLKDVFKSRYFPSRLISAEIIRSFSTILGMDEFFVKRLNTHLFLCKFSVQILIFLWHLRSERKNISLNC